MVRCAALLMFLAGAVSAQEQAPAAGAPGTDTLRDFAAYIRLTESRVDAIARGGDSFLWANTPERRARVRQAGVICEPRNGKGNLQVRGGLIHHWVGSSFIAGATTERVLEPIQDYDNHKNTYRPEVIESKTLAHHGNDFKVRLRLVKRKVVSVVLEVDSDVHYQPLAGHDWMSRAYSTRVVEIDNAGGPRERVRPAAKDRGYLWRLNTYWLFRERDGGVYVECEAVSLSRDIPEGLGWLIEPIVGTLPRDELVHTLTATRSLVLRGLARR